MRPLLPLALAALLLTLPAASARASSVTTEAIKTSVDSKGVEWYATRVVWSADAGERNRLDVRTEPGTGRVVLRDEGAPIRAGEGCEASPDGTAACAITSGERIESVVLDGGDGDDALLLVGFDGALHGGDGDDVLTATGSGLLFRLDGGPGDDTLTGGDDYSVLDGGTGSDTIQGGSGTDWITGDPPGGPYAPDRIDGGPGGSSLWGVDTVVYDRPTAVAVDLAAGSGGAPGEGDTIAGIEGIQGGDAADELRGSEQKDVISGGGGGADLLDGRGGDDKLSAGSDPATRLFGGAGDDLVLSPAGEIDCGPGADRVRDPEFAAVVATASCEQVYSDGGFFARLPSARGRVLQLRLRGTYFEIDHCGAFVALRPARGGRPLARRFVLMRAGAPRGLRLAAVRPLPARVRVDVRVAYCRGESVRPRPFSRDPYSDPPVPLRFTAALR